MTAIIKPISLAFSLSFTLVSFIPVQVLSSESILDKKTDILNSNSQLNQQLFNAPDPPPDVETSDNRGDGGNRGCENAIAQIDPSQPNTLTALAPIYKSTDSELVWGLTSIEDPTFLFYVPYLSPATGKIVVYDSENNSVYNAEFTLTGKAGIVSISIPEKTLKMSQRYSWYFKIYCDPGQPPAFVNGWIDIRDSLNANVKQELERATPRDRVTLLANHGMWYDAIATAAQIRRTDPNYTDWNILLQEVGLSPITSGSIIECCQAKK